MSKIEEVRGKTMLIRFDGQKCIHSRSCVLSRPDVFVPNVEGEWIHPDRATPAELENLALNCPSGAIAVATVDGKEIERPPQVNLAKVRENGPLALHGELVVEGFGPMTRATLCRCGASANKPFCDGSHTSAKFVATGEPETKESTPLPVRAGPLNIAPRPNGPNVVTGSLEVVTGTGRTINRVQKTFLCRCGASANKPYCDGSHTKIGFTG